VPRELRDVVHPASTVLLLQECQKGVIGDASSLPELAASARATIIPNLVRLTAAARAAGVKVIHATAAHQPDYWGANTNARLFKGARRSPVQLVLGAEAAEPLDELVGPGDLVFARQHGLSPLQGTELDAMLRNERIRTIVLVGVSLNVAIPNVTFDAVNCSYDVVIPRDAVASTPPEYGEQILANTLAYIADLVTTDDLVAAWR
jgi:nicotinamidase-related amidase